MKKTYLFLLVLFVAAYGLTTTAQTTLSTAVDFNVTDTKGVKHNLFDILKTGKYVCIDFFFTTCGPCIKSSPHFKSAFTTYGCNTKDVFFIAMDLRDTDVKVNAFEKSYLGGDAGYPLISGVEGQGTDVCDYKYHVNVYPTYILIAPNKKIVEQNMDRNLTDFDAYFKKYGIQKFSCTTTGLNEKNITTDFQLYPNPAINSITLESSTNTNFENVRVYSILGKTLINKPINSSAKYELTISSLKRGVYFVEVTTTNKKTFIKKFSKF